MTDPSSDTDTDSDIAAFDADLFVEPAGFRPATPPPSFEAFAIGSRTLQIELIGGRDSLWAHRVWNGGVALARAVAGGRVAVAGRRVLELGAAAALPALLAASAGAECVVATDFPDPRLLATIARNCAKNCCDEVGRGALKVVGHQWGHDLAPVLAALPDARRKFDVIFLADLIFNHTEHAALLKTCAAALEPSPQSCMYIYFSHHNVHWADKDMKFFDLATDAGFLYEKLDSVKAEAMFPDDTGDLEVRTTVHCYRMWREYFNK
ncbi:hypothetical protein BDR26DRAFT_302970 [Obelidium mucronatum]|nr:hypothetical protein BDR26DRAFT_302970 [Obelidium mucronatum]